MKKYCFLYRDKQTCITEKHIGFYQRRGQSIIYRLNDALDGLSCHLLAARPGDKEDYIKFAIFASILRILSSVVTHRGTPQQPRQRTQKVTPSLTGSWQLVSSSSSATSIVTRGNILTRDHNLTRGSLCTNIVTFYADFDPEKQLLYWTLDGIKNTLYWGSHSVYLDLKHTPPEGSVRAKKST